MATTTDTTAGKLTAFDLGARVRFTTRIFTDIEATVTGVLVMVEHDHAETVMRVSTADENSEESTSFPVRHVTEVEVLR